MPAADTFPALLNDWRKVGEVERCEIASNGEGWFRVRADLDVDGDGANGHKGRKPCYAPRSYGRPTLDDLAMAGHPGKWWGVVTDNGREDGTPLIQTASDPAPGAFISQTAYHLRGPDGAVLEDRNPDKYLDSEVFPFIVLPLPCAILAGAEIVLGSMAWVRYKGQFSAAVVGDKGPTRKIGEGSPRLCRNIGVNSSARNGGVDELEVWYYWHPGEAAVIHPRFIEGATEDTTFRLQRWRDAA